MTRVLLDTRVLNTTQPTGLSRYAAALFEHLVRRQRFEYLAADGDAGIVPGAISLPFDIPLADGQAAARWFEAVCRLYDVDLLFSPYLPVPAIRDTRVVLTVHDLIAIDHPEWFADRSVFRFFDGPLRESARGADRLVTGSHAAANDLTQIYGVERSRITVVPHAASPAFAPGMPADADRVRAVAGGDVPFVLSVATLEPRKNFERLVEAYDRMRERDRGARWRLVIVGRLGWNCGSLLERIARSPFRDDIVHTGHVDDGLLVDLYRACHVFAYTSLAEGFGLPLLEALACGCVVVASDIPVHREVAGPAACYGDPLDVDALTGALWRAVNDGAVRGQLREASTARAGMFSWDLAAASTEQVFSDALRLRD
jgi:glycosyltransferase involved in cell wall biosynthesis